jgi:membrane-anchored glycerophosphoryl diester phosphodiesterase (GDPDase)
VETAELRPLSLGELLDRTFTLYRGNFWVFVGIMAIPAALGIPITYLVLQFDVNLFANPATPVAPSPGLILGFLGGYFLLMILLMIVYSIVAAAITYAVSESYLGRRASIAAAYKSVRGKVWRLFGVAVNVILRLIGIMMAVGAVIGLVGSLILAGLGAAGAVATGSQIAMGIVVVIFVLGLYISALSAMIYLALRYAVAIPALVLENLGVLASIRRSVQLTRGRRGHVFIALLLAWIISIVGLMVFYMPFYVPTMILMARSHAVPGWLAMMSSVSAAAGSSITSPIFLIVLVLCYYDTRIRKEAFDLQFMMASLDRPAPAAGTAPSA